MPQAEVVDTVAEVARGIEWLGTQALTAGLEAHKLRMAMVDAVAELQSALGRLKAALAEAKAALAEAAQALDRQ